jgi:hypothetical protein
MNVDNYRNIGHVYFSAFVYSERFAYNIGAENHKFAIL